MPGPTKPFAMRPFHLSHLAILVPFILYFLLSGGCVPPSPNRDTGSSKEKQAEETAQKGGSSTDRSDRSIGNPFGHKSMDPVLFPVRKHLGRGRKDRRTLSWKEEDQEKPIVHHRRYGGFQRNGHFLNLIVWDPTSDRKSLLRDSLFHMTHFRYYPLADADREGFMLYRLIPKDRNGDGKFRRNDGTALFYSLPDGSEWKRLTPKGHRVIRVHVLKKESTILIRTEQGRGKEKSVHHLRTSIKDPRLAEPFFPTSFKERLDSVLSWE